MTDIEKVIAGLTMLADRKNDDTCEGLKCCKIAEDAIAILKEQDSVIEALKSDLDETLAVLGEYAEIVRCRDCVHAEPERVEEEIWCPITCSLRSMDWFCADGERKEGM